MRNVSWNLWPSNEASKTSSWAKACSESFSRFLKMRSRTWLFNLVLVVWPNYLNFLRTLMRSRMAFYCHSFRFAVRAGAVRFNSRMFLTWSSVLRKIGGRSFCILVYLPIEVDGGTRFGWLRYGSEAIYSVRASIELSESSTLPFERQAYRRPRCRLQLMLFSSLWLTEWTHPPLSSSCRPLLCAPFLRSCGRSCLSSSIRFFRVFCVYIDDLNPLLPLFSRRLRARRGK